MKTIKLSKNNFWIKLSRLFISDYPTNTCGLRKTLLLGIPLLLIFPLGVLMYNLTPGKEDCEELSVSTFFYFLVCTWIFEVMPLVITINCANFTMNVWSILAIIYILGPVSLFLMLLTIVLIIVGLVVLVIHITRHLKSNKSGIVTETYTSVKDKVCKKIIIE